MIVHDARALPNDHPRIRPARNRAVVINGEAVIVTGAGRYWFRGPRSIRRPEPLSPTFALRSMTRLKAPT